MPQPKHNISIIRTPSQNDVLKGVANGDPDAIKKLKEDYFPFILRTLDRIDFGKLVFDHVRLAEIIFRETVKYIKSVYFRGKTIGNLEGVFYRITRRVTNKDFKELKKAGIDIELDEDYPDESGNKPDEELIRLEEIREKESLLYYLRICFLTLSKREQDIIKLWWEENTWADIARHFGVTRSAISQSKNNAFAKLLNCVLNKGRLE